MFCEKCGAKLTLGVQFCTQCGVAVKSEVSVKKASVVVRSKRRVGLLCGSVAVVLLVGILLFLTRNRTEVNGYFTSTYNWRGWLISDVYRPYSGPVETIEYTYDRKGHLTSSQSSDTMGNSSETVYLYDEAWNCISQHTEYSDGTAWEYYYNYDEDGRLVTGHEKWTDEVGYEWERDYEYDENGNLAKRFYWEDDTYYEYICTYNEIGKCIETEHILWPYGDESWKEYSWEDTNVGQLESERWLYSDGTAYNCEYTYNETGLVVAKNIYSQYSDGEDLWREVTYDYDESGKLIAERSFWTDSEGEEKWEERVYDTDGNVVRHTEEDGLIKTERIYDSQMNVLSDYHRTSDEESWIECTYTESGKPLSGYYYDKAGNEEWLEYTYNNDGLLASQYFAYANGEEEWVEFSYDEDGAVLWGYHTFSDGVTGETKYTYNEYGQPVLSEYNASDGANGYVVYGYDGENQEYYISEGAYYYVQSSDIYVVEDDVILINSMK